MEKPSIPLVYLCSDCSNAAQMANQLAIRLDRTNLAMSCIAARSMDSTSCRCGACESVRRESRARQVVSVAMPSVSDAAVRSGPRHRHIS
ncbi:MAG: hypothetical protein IPG25_16760 [Proteobacteria bacterium]|nr:hypothetical protein [Pseudomonadota bacterium]